MTDEQQQRIHDAMAACRAILDFTYPGMSDPHRGVG